MPNLIKSITRTPEEQVQFVSRQFRRALDASKKRRDRLYDNLSYYFGDQIPDNIKTKMTQEQREAMVFNISQRKVTGLVGSLLRNNFDILYTSIDGSNTTLIQAVQDMLEADQNSSNWDYQLMTWIKYGLIEDAVMEMTYSDRESPLGNLMFECTSPGSVVIDPNWRSSNSRDMQECFKYVYLSPDQILDIYPDATDDVRAALLENVRLGRDYDGTQSDVDINRDFQSRLAGDYMVLQHTYMQSEVVAKEIDISTGMELPETEDQAYKLDWININGVDPEYVREIKYSKRIVKVCTTIPGLPLKAPVVSANHPFQIERLPFFPWSPDRINGETQSIIDITKTMQDVLNKRENMINNILETSAYGAMAIDPAIVGNDPDLKKALQAQFSNPRLKFFTQEGALSGGKKFFEPFPKNNPPSELFAQINHLWEAVDRVLPINAAADGRSESSQESGILFSMKQNAIEVAQTTLVRGLMAVLTEMGDAYFRAAKAFYSNVERTFVKPDGSTFKINEVVALPNGDMGIRNDVSSLQNLKTLVKMGPDSPNTRFSRRLTAIDLLKTIPPNFQSLQAAVIGELIETIDSNEETKKDLDAAVERSKALAAAREDAEMQQLTAPPPQAMPQPGAPQPGQEQAPAGNPLMAALAPLLKGGAAG